MTKATIATTLLSLLSSILLFGLGYIPTGVWKSVKNPLKKCIYVVASAIVGLLIICSSIIGLCLSLILAPIFIWRLLK